MSTYISLKRAQGSIFRITTRFYFYSREVKGETTTMYHETSPKSAQSILQSQTMRLGSKGLAGGSIYLCDNHEQCGHKAEHHGVILQIDVKLGTIKDIYCKKGSKNEYQPWHTLLNLNKSGHDSIRINERSGLEYAIYNPNQISNIRFYKNTK